MRVVIKKIKQSLKKFYFLVKVKKYIWRKLNLGMGPPQVVDGNYYQKLFNDNINSYSLSFDEGLVKGSFKSHNYVMLIRPKNLIETHIFLDGLWEPHIAELISSFLKDGGVVLDIGANIGASTIPLAKVHPRVNFYLYEPHPGVFIDLCRNIAYNRLENINAFPMAVTNSEDEFLPFYAQKNANNFGLSSFKKNHDIKEYDIIKVKILSIDIAFVENEGKVQVIKIDTQGTELQVLLSAKKTIKKHRPIIIFEFESEYFENQVDENIAKKELVNFFEEVAYDLFMITNDTHYYPKVTLASYFHGDIIAIPRSF